MLISFFPLLSLQYQYHIKLFSSRFSRSCLFVSYMSTFPQCVPHVESLLFQFLKKQLTILRKSSKCFKMLFFSYNTIRSKSILYIFFQCLLLKLYFIFYELHNLHFHNTALNFPFRFSVITHIYFAFIILIVSLASSSSFFITHFIL